MSFLKKSDISASSSSSSSSSSSASSSSEDGSGGSGSATSTDHENVALADREADAPPCGGGGGACGISMTICDRCGQEYNAALPPSVHEEWCFDKNDVGKCGKPGCTVPFAHHHN